MGFTFLRANQHLFRWPSEHLLARAAAGPGEGHEDCRQSGAAIGSAAVTVHYNSGSYQSRDGYDKSGFGCNGKSANACLAIRPFARRVLKLILKIWPIDSSSQLKVFNADS